MLWGILGGDSPSSEISAGNDGNSRRAVVYNWMTMEDGRLIKMKDLTKEVWFNVSESPVGLVAIFGKARQGKSFLMNCLAGEKSFKISNRKDPCTIGIDIASKWMDVKDFARIDGGRPPHNADDVKVGFVDAEGQGDRDISYDAKLVCPILIASKCIIFNWKETLQKDSILNLLGVMTQAASEVEENISMKPSHTFGDENNNNGNIFNANNGKNNRRSNNIIDVATNTNTNMKKKKFGHLHIVFRDWSSVDGSRESVYKTVFDEESDPAAGIRNRIRRDILASFESIEVHLFEFPMERTSGLKTELTFEMTTPTFRNQVKSLRESLAAQLSTPTKIGDMTLTGTGIQQIVGSAIEQLNSGKTVKLMSMYSSLLRSKVDQLRTGVEADMRECLKRHLSDLEAKVSKGQEQQNFSRSTSAPSLSSSNMTPPSPPSLVTLGSAKSFIARTLSFSSIPLSPPSPPSPPSSPSTASSSSSSSIRLIKTEETIVAELKADLDALYQVFETKINEIMSDIQDDDIHQSSSRGSYLRQIQQTMDFCIICMTTSYREVFSRWLSLACLQAEAEINETITKLESEGIGRSKTKFKNGVKREMVARELELIFQHACNSLGEGIYPADDLAISKQRLRSFVDLRGSTVFDTLNHRFSKERCEMQKIVDVMVKKMDAAIKSSVMDVSKKNTNGFKLSAIEKIIGDAYKEYESSACEKASMIRKDVDCDDIKTWFQEAVQQNSQCSLPKLKVHYDYLALANISSVVESSKQEAVQDLKWLESQIGNGIGKVIKSQEALDSNIEGIVMNCMTKACKKIEAWEIEASSRDSKLDEIRSYIYNDGSPGNKVLQRLQKKLDAKLAKLLKEQQKVKEDKKDSRDEMKEAESKKLTTQREKDDYAMKKEYSLTRMEQEAKFHLSKLLEKEEESRQLADAAADAERRANALKSKLRQDAAEQAWKDKKESWRRKAVSETYQFIQNCAEGNDKAVLNMLYKRSGLILETDDDGDTGAHVAAKNGKLSTLAILVREGTDINASNHEGNTPLHYACHYGHVNIVKNLLQNGASVRACNALGKTPIGMVDSHISPDDLAQIVEALQSYSDYVEIANGIGIYIPWKGSCAQS